MDDRRATRCANPSLGGRRATPARGGRALIALALALMSSAVQERARADTVRFSETRGFRDAPFLLTLASPNPTDTIRYTTDGSAPTASFGARYAKPIKITRTTVVRAVAYGSDSESAPAPTTHTFVLPRTVAAQPALPAGYITSFRSVRQRSRELTFDYAMDPEVLGDPASGDLATHLTELPSLSIALAREDFNDLYTNHRRRGADWERSASVELMYPERERYAQFRGFQADCGFRMQGGLAADQARKKSFRLLFKKEHGSGKLEYPLFESAVHHAHSAVERFDTVVLRAGGNTNWSKELAYKHAPSAYLRDQLVRDSEIAMTGLGARGIFVHLYVNGLYFGLYNITERPDAKFLAAYLGGQETDYGVVNHGGVVAGDASRWNRLLETVMLRGGDPDARRRTIEELLDLDAFCDYVLLNWYSGTGDWPYNNWYVGGRTKPAGKLRFHSWDAELAFWTVDYHYSHPGAWVHPLFSSGRIPISRIWLTLAEDPEFLLRFADRVQKHCFRAGALSDRAMGARFRSLADAIEGPIVAESARWGDSAWGQEDDPRTREQNWRPSRDAIAKILQRNVARFVRALRERGYFPSIDPPAIEISSLESESETTAAVRVVLRNPNRRGAVSYSIDGSDPREPERGRPSRRRGIRARQVSFELRETARVRARVRVGEEWSALLDQLVLIGTTTSPLRFSEIMYQPTEGEEFEFIEIENPSAASIELTGAYLSGVDYHFPPGSVIAPRQRLLLVPNDDPAAFRARYPGAEIAGTYRGHLANEGERVQLVNRRGVAMCSVTYGADAAGATRGADGTGRSLERAGGADDAAEANRWRPSAVEGGTPGR